MEIRTYQLTGRNAVGEIIRYPVEGIEIFKIKGHAFFLHREFPFNVISDVEYGYKVYQDFEAAEAIAGAYKKLKDNWAKFLKAREKARKEYATVL